MRVDILSKEYPPAIYGGAGVHVAELVRALRDRGDMDVRVHAFGEARDEAGTHAYAALPELDSANPAIQTMGVDLAMVGGTEGSDLVHSHTWYANFAGHVASLLYHCLVFWGLVTEALVPCGKGGSCADAEMQIVGFVPIPLLSVAAFTMILVLLWVSKKEVKT